MDTEIKVVVDETLPEGVLLLKDSRTGEVVARFINIDISDAGFEKEGVV